MIGTLARVFQSWGRPKTAEPRHALVGRPDLWRMKRAFQIDFLRRQGLRSSDRLLDIGCGSLRGGAALIAYLDAAGYCGIDVRANVLAAAQQELHREKLHGKRAELVLAADMAVLELGRRFDVLWAFSVLFHLSDPVLEGCLAMVARHMDEGGVFFANVIVGDGPPGEWQGFPVASRPLGFYQELARRHGFEAQAMGTLAQWGHDSGDPSQDSQCMLRFARPGHAGASAPQREGGASVGESG